MKETDKVPCPIPQTHTRLNQAFSMFSEVSARYQKPDEFTVTLNDLIQSLRNITFILQAEKAKVPNFDNWYAPHQAEMKADEVLRWLVEARNHVVKRGDLEKKSHLTLRVKDHLDQNLFVAEFNPYISLEEAAIRFKKAIKIKIPKHYEDETIIEAEREWVIENFPKAEIADILIYCFSILTKVVYEAHAACDVHPLCCDHNTFLQPGQDFMVVIRNDIKKGRILKVLYNKDKTLTVKEISFSMSDKVPNSDETSAEHADKHYGLPKDVMGLIDTTGKNLPFSQVKYHIAMARYLFGIDGHVQSVAFLYFPNRQPVIIQLTMEEPEDRYVMAERIAEKVEETHCAAVLTVGEVWVGDLPKKGEEQTPPRLQKNKREQVMILAASSEKTEMHLIEIHRKPNGTATLGEETKEVTDNTAGFLSRVYKVWEYQQKKE